MSVVSAERGGGEWRERRGRGAREDRERERQTDVQTDKQMYRQTDRERESERVTRFVYHRPYKKQTLSAHCASTLTNPCFSPVSVDELKRALTMADPELDTKTMDAYVSWAFSTTPETLADAEPLEQSKLLERLMNGNVKRVGKKM